MSYSLNAINTALEVLKNQAREKNERQEVTIPISYLLGASPKHWGVIGTLHVLIQSIKDIVSIFLPKSNWRISWKLFWLLYFLIGDIEQFHHNYMHAWIEHATITETQRVDGPLQDYSVVMFIDSGQKFTVPCWGAMNDREFINHISRFHYVEALAYGILGLFSFKIIKHIEVAELQQADVLGARQYILGLGRFGPGNRLISYRMDPTAAGDSTNVVDKLGSGVYVGKTPPSEHQENEPAPRIHHDPPAARIRSAPPVNPPNLPASQAPTNALNVVLMWNTRSAASIVFIPMGLSLLFCIIWPLIAVVRYNADVNLSVTTGFTIGIYVITTGAVLIGVVAFLDTQNKDL